MHDTEKTCKCCTRRSAFAAASKLNNKVNPSVVKNGAKVMKPMGKRALRAPGALEKPNIRVKELGEARKRTPKYIVPEIFVENFDTPPKVFSEPPPGQDQGVWYCIKPSRPNCFPYHNNSVFLPPYYLPDPGTFVFVKKSPLSSSNEGVPPGPTEQNQQQPAPGLLSNPGDNLSRRSISAATINSTRRLSELYPARYERIDPESNGFFFKIALSANKSTLLNRLRRLFAASNRRFSLRRKRSELQSLVQECY
ncbi:hypothetical protein K493DRAFT_299442 [Basidiobolus meristosporus CBS 931.73]|uniref:Uncharacterized protein n=1 Tax=Basidiobolus meristosporus CBS 931.73 TaxID=1314790 RepID=A0A1Y1YMY2_9FUNG|nr:hypothetical protein K493DRAFT_299442 [Basidiobolus meristosporus CBS 931.73]|eukprot:ORX99335.1 hypothetical protein K493DRAFT_299442 [Basidiobolus meristosporus CBS 931.73]